MRSVIVFVSLTFPGFYYISKNTLQYILKYVRVKIAQLRNIKSNIFIYQTSLISIVIDGF